MEPMVRSWTVLLVDDNVGFAELLRRAFLRDGRFEIVGTASNGVEAIALAGDLRPGVIVLDDAMPVKTGLEALPEIVAASPATKVVLFSANLHARATLQALDGGAVAAISKLEPLRALFEVIEQSLGII